MSLIYDAIRENEAPTSGPMPEPAAGLSLARRTERGQASSWPAVIVFLVIVVLGALVLGWWYHARTVAFTQPVANEAATGAASLVAPLSSPSRSQTAAVVVPSAPAPIVESTAAETPQSSVGTLSVNALAPPPSAVAEVTTKEHVRSNAEEFPASAASAGSSPDQMAMAPSAGPRGRASADAPDVARSPAAHRTRTSQGNRSLPENVARASRAPHKSPAPAVTAANARASLAAAQPITPGRASPATAHQQFDAFMQAMRSNDLTVADSRLAALRQELGPNSLTLLRAESWLALAHKDLVAARRGYTALLERLPGDEEASINLASVELQENHVAAAREVLSDALRTHPDSEALSGAIARFQEIRR